MSEVAIIIPYYQREPGILRTAIQSIYAQEIPLGVTVRVVIADDQSPVPPEPEFAAFWHSEISVEVVKRENGGPAKARNTGLDTVRHADVVAFLDSDDFWDPHHLAKGLAALAQGAEFYFANNFYEDKRTWFDGLEGIDALKAASRLGDDGIYHISGASIMPFMLQDCLAHTSTVMFDNRIHGAMRFDEDLAFAGEDYLFWLTLSSKAKAVAFSAAPMAARGRGMDLYRGALDWNRPECIRRLFYALLLHKKVRERFCTTSASKSVIDAKIVKLRQGIIYLLIRNGLVHRRISGWIIRELARKDRRFWVEFPRNAYETISGKLRGNFEFPIG
ncbi:glycosyltransferase family A protein [Hyphomicrobium sp. MC1]|uniref:glycosyltransferase family A protein n=1 Tax=Hyphomicrobium sp. (strain MC1) TaxID=717785 RepID=UPI0002F2160B|nr:glycosyltransferase family 2 protein [Hyphomicrobium sp. MC1]